MPNNSKENSIKSYLEKKMKLNHLKGFSLIELIVAISISTIVIGGIFNIYSNINSLEKITTKKSHDAIKIAYAYNLLKNDLSNSIPGIINDELSIVLSKKNELTLHRVSLEKNSHIDLKIMKVKWHINDGKLYRSLFNFGNQRTINKELIHNFKKEINFKIEKVSNLYISNKNSQSLPSLISIEFGADNEEVYSFRVGNNL